MFTQREEEVIGHGGQGDGLWQRLLGAVRLPAETTTLCGVLWQRWMLCPSLSSTRNGSHGLR